MVKLYQAGSMHSVDITVNPNLELLPEPLSIRFPIILAGYNLCMFVATKILACCLNNITI